MKKFFAVLLLCAAVWSSQAQGSVRFLRGGKEFRCGYRDRSVELIAYTGDPYFNRVPLKKKEGIITDISFSSQFQLGFRLEKRIGRVVIGPDYSFDHFKADYNLAFHISKVPADQISNTHRMSASLHYTLLWRSRMSGYVALRTGYRWTYAQIKSDPASPRYTYKTSQWSLRTVWGMRFLLRRRFGLNLEAGYGGGAYVQAGITMRIYRFPFVR